MQELKDTTNPSPKNLSQTIQIVVLRILQALGWNIWNPAEVFAHDHDLDTSNSDVPHLELLFNGKSVVAIEVMPPGHLLTDHSTQALLRYAFTYGIKCAVLTNGYQWWLHFQDEGQSFDGSRVTIDITNAPAADELEGFLARLRWATLGAAKAPVAIAHSEATGATGSQEQPLESIERALEKAFRGTGKYSQNLQGLLTALRMELGASDYQEALDNLDTLAKHLGVRDVRAPRPGMEIEAGLSLRLGNEAETQVVLNALTTEFELLIAGVDGGVRLYLANQLTPARSWIDTLVAVSNTFVSLQREDGLLKVMSHYGSFNLVRPEDRRPKYIYRKLSNGMYLNNNRNGDASRRLLVRLLMALGTPKSLVRVTFKGKEFCLP